MEKRNTNISLEKAREWYEGGNITLKQLALEAYSEEELKEETSYLDILNKLRRSGKLVIGPVYIGNIIYDNIEKIRVLNKLYTIAAYFNGDWVPTYGSDCYYIYKTCEVIGVACNSYLLSPAPYFKSKEDAQKALEIFSPDELNALFK